VELLYEIELSNQEILKTTWNHPFYVITEISSRGPPKGEWVEVRNLSPGDKLYLGSGKSVEITRIVSENVIPTKVYNFEVEDNHTYFVGEDGVLVHNYRLSTTDIKALEASPVGKSIKLLLLSGMILYEGGKLVYNTFSNDDSIDGGDIPRDTSLSPKEAQEMKRLGLDPVNISDIAEFKEKSPSQKGKDAYEKGKIGEDKVKSLYDIGDKQSFQINGRTRIPDGANRFAISEVKNVKYQGWTQQLQDYSDIAKESGIPFNLYLHKDARRSKNLIKAWEEGKVNIIDFD
jgi:hypothetical protein